MQVRSEGQSLGYLPWGMHVTVEMCVHVTGNVCDRKRCACCPSLMGAALPECTWLCLCLRKGMSERIWLDSQLCHPLGRIVVGLKACLGIYMSVWLMQAGEDDHNPD